MRSVGGTQEIINNLMMHRSKLLRRVGEAVEKSAVDVANGAKADHQRGQGHGMGRYENQATTLTRSITPKLTKVNFDEAEAIIFTNVEYAARVEAIYPYLWPAMVANQEKFKRRVKEAGYK